MSASNPADSEASLPRPVHWLGSSYKDLKTLPAGVQREMGHALWLAQQGEMSDHALVMQGFGGASVLEIRENFQTDTFRVVYTVRFARAVYVLHAFQKKSHQGIKTDQKDMDLVRTRLKAAQIHYEATYPGGK